MRRRRLAAVLALLPLALLLGAPQCAGGGGGGTLTASSLPGGQPDQDGDLVPDWCDNCRLAANRSQLDADFDGLGNVCDCDLDRNGVCNIDDFNLFLPDYGTGTASPGVASDLDGNGVVDDADYALFEPLFSSGAPGPGRASAAPVDGSCDPAVDPTCSDPFRPGACWDHRIAAQPDGTGRAWRFHPPSDGCDLDPQLLVDAGHPEAAADPNNPTDALRAAQSGGAVRCPNAAFATFPAGATCDATLPCDPRDQGKLCGAPDGRGGVVSCGDVDAPRACELLDGCRGQCGYREFDCVDQYRRNLMATCEALTGAERDQCHDACVTFATLYADAAGAPPDPGPGVWAGEDLARQQELCTCCPGPGPGGSPPAVCGDGFCDPASESCHPSSCPTDCGSCGTGSACLVDADCGVGRCGPTGVCEPVPAGGACVSGADCRSGSCVAGFCEAVCGDGFCDGVETCGASDPDSCQADCGDCANDAACSADLDCISGTCSNGACLGLAPDVPCTRAEECQSGICDFGLCVDRPKAAGESCGLDIGCQPWQGVTVVPGQVGLCDLGFCTAGPKPAGAACERDKACEATIAPELDSPLPPVGVCNLGVCVGTPLPVGSACDKDLACEPAFCEDVATPAGRAIDCRGVCNLGSCIDTVVPLGGACDDHKACGKDAFCVGGTCRLRALEPCSSGSDCATGVCDPGSNLCTSLCGDGLCDVRGSELCGPDDILTCRSDCGSCDAINGLVRLVAPDVLCIYDEDCTSGICNFGVCLAGPNGPGTLCSTDSACWSGICNFGVCVEQTRGVNTPCTTNEVCASGACNFGLCVAQQSLGNGHPCTTGEACQGGVCNFGLCSDPVPVDGVCSTSLACAEPNVCNLGICTPPGLVGSGLPCTADGACASGFCAGLLIEPGKLPLPGVCAARCGDGTCTPALESCGFTNVLTRCFADCGQCGSGSPCLSGYDCATGICDLGLCSDGQEPNGSVCASNSVCASGICNFGFCIAAPQPSGVPCTTDAACRSGDCTAGFCIQKCGDGFCDGLEKCGDSDSGLECTRDCARCGNGDVCLSNADCTSGICNFGFCIGGDLPAGSPCTTSLACRSGNCTAGLCIQSCGDGFCDGTETCGVSNPLACTTDCGRCNAGTPCLANNDCATGGCNFGFCASGLSNGTPCSTSAVCASGRCLAGVCAPQTFCGDFSCNGGETCGSCPTDCGICPFCGDLSCNNGESCSSCALDCGPCCRLTGSGCSSGSQCCTGVCTFLNVCL